MRKIALAIFLMLTNALAGQDSLKIFISADQIASDVLTPERIYEYSQFGAGKIFFRDGSSTEASLNYNYLNGEIEFVAPGRDTLAISKEQMLNIKKVVFNNHTYFYNKGYLEQVFENAGGKLLRKQILDVIKREKIGGYSQPNSTSAIDSYGSFADNYGIITPNLKIRENITLILKSNYYFGNKYNIFLPANKKNLLKTYPSKKSQINAYLKKHRTDFKNEQDLKKLLALL